MMEYYKQLDPAIPKWIKCVIVLLLAKVDSPLQLSSFFALNPVFRKILAKTFEKIGNPKVDIIKNNINSLSNLISCSLLYGGTLDNPKIAKDYILLYIWTYYLGILSPKVKEARSMEYISNKFASLNTQCLKYILNQKEKIFYSMMFGQILSTYLTPVSMGRDRYFLSDLIKLRILNPIWLNYSLSKYGCRFNWLCLSKSYLRHNLIFGAIFGSVKYYRVAVSRKNDAVRSKKYNSSSYFRYAFHKANSISNFIYLQNLLSILMISATSSMIPGKSKTAFKTYIKIIGFLSAYISFYSDILFYGECKPKPNSTMNIRKISNSFLKGMNLYIFRLILLSKWRKFKATNELLNAVTPTSWSKIESLLMCFGLFKLMNYNDLLRASSIQQREGLMKLIDKIM